LGNQHLKLSEKLATLPNVLSPRRRGQYISFFSNILLGNGFPLLDDLGKDLAILVLNSIYFRKFSNGFVKYSPLPAFTELGKLNLIQSLYLMVVMLN
jgi:hypothetical protein